MEYGNRLALKPGANAAFQRRRRRRPARLMLPSDPHDALLRPPMHPALQAPGPCPGVSQLGTAGVRTTAAVQRAMCGSWT